MIDPFFKSKKPIFYRTLAVAVLFVCAIFLMLGAAETKSKKPDVEILWDTWGVPHIFAQNLERLFYAFGWAQMEANGDAILRLYGEARARAAEYWGEEYLESDKYLRRLGLPKLAAAWVKAQPEDFKLHLEAFVNGMNDYAAKNLSGIDESVQRVLPVTIEDIMAHSIRTVHITFLGISESRAVEKWSQAGSNAWAIAPSHSESGNAMLLMNPHLAWIDRFRWFEVQLKAPGIDAYGVTFIGSPVYTLAFNNDLGWTHTVNTIDGFDLYEIQLVNGGYLLDGKARALETETDTLKVRDKSGDIHEVKLIIHRTVHGPIIAEKGGKALAVRIAGLDQPGLLQQYFEMTKAATFPEFDNAIRKLQVPMFNLLYADREGHIFYLFGGRVPRRPKGDFSFWQGIIDGSSSETIWTETHPYEDLPKVVDPPSGWLQNANDPPWICTYPPVLNPDKYTVYMAPRDMPFRPQRSCRMLMEDSKISFEEFIKYKASTRMELADRIMDELMEAAINYGTQRAKEAAVVLKAWDRSAEADSRGAVLFQTWLREAGRDFFAVPWDIKNPLSTPKGLKDPASAAAALDRAAEKTIKDYGSLDIPWGQVNRLKVGDKEFPGIGGSGMLGIFNVISYAPGDKGIAYSSAGETFTMMVEFSNPPKARALLLYGNISQKGSKHIGDQLELFSKKQYRPVWTTRNEVGKHLEKTEGF